MKIYIDEIKNKQINNKIIIKIKIIIRIKKRRRNKQGGGV